MNKILGWMGGTAFSREVKGLHNLRFTSYAIMQKHRVSLSITVSCSIIKFTVIKSEVEGDLFLGCVASHGRTKIFTAFQQTTVIGFGNNYIKVLLKNLIHKSDFLNVRYLISFRYTVPGMKHFKNGYCLLSLLLLLLLQ